MRINLHFFNSGFLTSYGVLRKLNKTNGVFSYSDFIFQRWIRFTLLLFGSILFYYLFPLTGDGPIWDIGEASITSHCKNPQNLLKMLFLVHNYSTAYLMVNKRYYQGLPRAYRVQSEVDPQNNCVRNSQLFFIDFFPILNYFMYTTPR